MCWAVRVVGSGCVSDSALGLGMWPCEPPSIASTSRVGLAGCMEGGGKVRWVATAVRP